MNPESSPFRPGQPAPVEFFVGRRAEIERVRGMVRASARGRVGVGFVSGERGIGKSSLARFARRLVEQHDGAVGCHVFLGGVRDLGQMLRRTFERLLNESTDKPWSRKLRDFFGDRVRKVGLFGVTFELDLPERDLAAVKHGFAASVRRLLEELAEHKRSLFLILDDINGLAGSDEFAHWLKSTVDEIAAADAETRLCILVAGLEARRQELVRRQPSLARVLDPIDVAPWTDDEVLDFYRRAFREGAAEISDEHVRVLARYTGGLPVLGHEIGDAVWRQARGPRIERGDVVEGIVAAAIVIGRKLLEPGIFQAITSERYRSIFRKMIDDPPLGMRFRRAQLRDRLAEAERDVLDNFLRRMKKLGAIETDPEVQGGYRFPNRLHVLYFRMSTVRTGKAPEGLPWKNGGRA